MSAMKRTIATANPSPNCRVCKRPAIRLFLIFSTFFLVSINLFAWTNGELLIWMDSARAQGLRLIANKFEKDLGVKVTIVTPQNITNDFPIAAQVGKGPDILIWAHDKVGEWADGGLIAPVEASNEFVDKFLPKAWQAVRYEEWVWGYPIAMETVTLIYNKRLLEGPPPKELSHGGRRKARTPFRRSLGGLCQSFESEHKSDSLFH
jgi:maltose-binding protein MalE